MDLEKKKKKMVDSDASDDIRVEEQRIIRLFFGRIYYILCILNIILREAAKKIFISDTAAKTKALVAGPLKKTLIVLRLSLVKINQKKLAFS